MESERKKQKGKEMTTNNKFEALEDESIEEGKTVEGKPGRQE